MNARAMYAGVKHGTTETLIADHAGLVKRIAFHLISRLPDSVQPEDLIQAGMIGLLEAARLFDATQGASFETYAGIRVRGAMLDEVRRNDWAPRSVHRRYREIARMIHQIENETGCEARDTEVCERLDITLDEFHHALSDAAQVRVGSIDHVGDEHDETLDVTDEGPRPDQVVTSTQFNRDLADSIETLPERERMVMSLYYVDELNQKEIGAVLGVSESRVCQILNKAVMRLKTALGDWQ